MPERKRENPHIDLLRSARFLKQGDRGTALLAGAWVDESLAEMIKSRLAQDKEVLEDFFRPEGPLGTFSSRIKMAYLIKLIDELTKRDLDLIRKIRNDFAHVRDDVRFTSTKVKARCGELLAAKAYENGAGAIRSYREKFLISCYFLAEIFFQQAAEKPRKTRELVPGTLHSYIRHRAKSFSINRMLDALGYDFENDPKKLSA